MRIGNFTATDAGRLLQLHQQQQQQQHEQLQLIVIGQVAVRHQLLSLSSVSVHVSYSFYVCPPRLCYPLLTAGVAAGSALDQQQQQETLRLLEAFQQYVLFSTRLAAITCNNLKAMPEGEGRGRRKQYEKGLQMDLFT